jgi:hypothetical protein
VSEAGVEYSASALGSCIKALAAARQELEPYSGPLPKNIQKAFDRGNEAEDEGVKWFEDRGWTVMDRQGRVELPLTGKIMVVGHIDFMVFKAADKIGTICVVDTKRQNDEEWAKESIRDSIFWHKYEWQFTIYSLATGVEFAVQRINDAGEVKLEMLSCPHTKAEVLARVLQVEAMAQRDLKGEECTSTDYPCPYWNTLHPDRGGEEEEPWEEVEDTELADIALHYKRLDIEMAPMKERREELRKELLKRVDSGRRIRESVSGITVRVTTSSVKEKHVPAGKMVRVYVELPPQEDG